MAKLITESFFDIELVEAHGSNLARIAGVFSTANNMVANGRIYEKDILNREVEKAIAKINEKSLFGELGHPPTPEINLDKVAILVDKLEWKGDNLWGSAKILDTPSGQIVKAIVKEGKIGISSRGLGTVDEATKKVNHDYRLITYDVVSSPSNQASWVNGIYEGKSFGDDNTEECHIEKSKKEKKSPNEIAKEAYESFGNYKDAMVYLREAAEGEAYNILSKQFQILLRK